MANQWDEKYLREQPFMAFGSMMNAFGRVNEGKNMEADEFFDVVDKLFDKAKELTYDAFNSTRDENDNVDIPIKGK